MHHKLSARFWLILTMFSLTGQIAWVVENMYLNVFIYKMFRATPGDISLMVAASAVSATLTTILMGTLSDRVGRRKPFMCIGYILWGISILAFTLIRADILEGMIPQTLSAMVVGAQLVILMDCIMTFFGSTANDAAFNAWLVDHTNSSNRGIAEGVNAMMPLVAMLAVFGGFMAFDLDRVESWSWIFIIIGIVVIAIGIAGCFLIRETRQDSGSSSYLADVLYGFRPDTVRESPFLYFYLLAFILFNISIQIFMPYLIIYYEVSLKMENYVMIMAPAVILASVVTALWGKVYDKKQFDFSIQIALLWLFAGYVMLYCFRSVLPVFVGSLLMMSGYLSGMAVFGAKIRDLIPSGKAGRFQGIRIVSQVLVPGIIGPWIGKRILFKADMIVNSDGTQSFVPDRNIFLGALIVLAVLFLLLFLGRRKQSPALNRDLKTPFETAPEGEWDEYPRPQMKRSSYISMNGSWELSVVKQDKKEDLGTILVPFPPESRISGIERALEKGEKYLYKRSFEAPSLSDGNRLLLHFGAVDQIAQVFLNEIPLGTHAGGYLPFSFDLTDSLRQGSNTLEVLVTDELDTELAYGKQRKARGGMWYTPISGIWQSVWMEIVPRDAIQSIRITPDEKGVTICTSGGLDEKELLLQTPHGERCYHYTGDSLRIEPESPRYWSPEDPYLYHFTLRDGTDSIESYFALRTISIQRDGKTPRILLNGKPYFFHGLLDQGYYSDGIYTPASPAGYRYDIQTMKDLGFNMLRKHIKMEPDLFYYYCDLYGMVVFQDMVNSGKYSFLLDTLLPTLGLKRGISHHASQRRRNAFQKDALETLELLHNHPSVCYYTIFNEGWGQYDGDLLYNMLKAADPTRIYDATSGWFVQRCSDVKSEHVYFKPLKLSPDSEKPLVLSEFGGYSCKIKGHAYNLKKTYGYRFFKESCDFEKALIRLYKDEVIPSIQNGLCATVLTQVSDVEDETNGLVTYDRQVVKVNRDEIRAIAKLIRDNFHP